MNNPSHGSRCSGRDSNRARLERKSVTLVLEKAFSEELG